MDNLIDASNFSFNEKVLMKQMLERGKFTVRELNIVPAYKESYENLWKEHDEKSDGSQK